MSCVSIRTVVVPETLARWRYGVLLVLVALLAGLVGAQETPLSPELDEIRSGELLLLAGPTEGRRGATRLSTEVAIAVSGMIARVSVVQIFENPSDTFSEAVYVFPLPEDAAVDSLRMRVGERLIEGEIQTREQAQTTYSVAKEAGQRASLVEQERPNLFTTSLANIAPGERVQVEISYLETLRFDAGSFHLRFPLAITPRYIPGQALARTYQPAQAGWAPATDSVPDAPRITPPYRRQDTPVGTVRLSVALDAGFPLAKVISAYHEVSSAQEGDVTHLELSGPVPADRDFELTWTPEVGARPGAALFTEAYGPETYALLMLMPPGLGAPQPVPPREVILVIDSSGSMEGLSLGGAKASLLLALDRLRPEDRFNILEFNSGAWRLFETSRLAKTATVNEAKRFVRSLRASGGTEIASALDLALQYTAPEGYLRQIVFITDGSVGNETELFGLIERNLGSGRLFTVGIGAAPNSYFMRKAAEFGRGSYTYVGTVDEVETKMSALFSKLETPVLTGLNLSLPDGAEAYPATVPDLYAGEPVVVSVKLTQPGGEAVLQGSAGNETWTRRLGLADARAEQTGVAQVWARAKLEALSDEAVRSGDPESRRDAIVRLALRHHLVSAYTSLVAVDKTPLRPAGAALTRDAVAQTLPHGQSYDAIFGAQTLGYPSTATNAPLNILTALAAFVLAALLLRRYRLETARQ